MVDSTTVQVPKEISERLGELGATKGEAIERLLATLRQKNTRTLSFKEKVKSGKRVTFVDDAPLNGAIKMIAIQWPPGTSFLVGVRVSHENTAILPKDGYLYKDDYSQPYVVDETVARGDNIFVEVNNQDDTYNHQITLEIVMVGEE